MSDSTQQPPPEEPGSYPPPQGGSYQPGTPPPPPMESAPGVGQPADLMTRFLARLIDYVLLAIVQIFVVGVIVVGAIMGSTTTGFGSDATFAASAVSAVLGAAIYLGYFAFMESSRGKTVGKMALKLETRGAAGGKPTLDEAVKRNAFTAIGVIGIIPVLGWFLSPLLSLAAVIMIAVTINNNTATRQGWHDQFAGGTSVIKVG